jgi:hypothetical protein
MTNIAVGAASLDDWRWIGQALSPDKLTGTSSPGSGGLLDCEGCQNCRHPEKYGAGGQVQPLRVSGSEGRV